MKLRPFLSDRWPGMLICVVGVLIAMASFLVDLLGFGSSPGTLGWKQVAGIISGIAVIILGLVITLRREPLQIRRRAERYLEYYNTMRLVARVTHGEMWTLVLVILLSTFLRFHGLLNQSLWYDDLETWRRSNYPTLQEVVSFGAQTEPWPPGQHVLYYFVVRFVGESEFILRFPAVLAGVLSTAAIYTLGRRVFDHATGMFAAILFATTETMIRVSQEVRAYAILVLFGVLATYFWWRLLQCWSRDKAPPWFVTLGYLIAALACAYLHYYGVLLIFLQGIGAALQFLREPRKLLTVVGVYGLTTIGYLPWIREVFKDLGTSSFWSWRPAPGGYFEELARIFQYYYWNQLILIVMVGIAGSSLLFGLIAAWVRAGRIQIRFSLLSPLLMLLCWLLAPFTVAYILSSVMVPFLYPRYLIISLPAFQLLLAWAIGIHVQLRRRLFTVVATLLAVASSLYLFLYAEDYSRVRTTSYREAVQYVIERDLELEGDHLILGVGYQWVESHFDYYFEQAGSDLLVTPRGCCEEDIACCAEEIANQDADHIWLLAAYQRPRQALLDFFSADFAMVEHVEFSDVEVWLYENPLGSP